MKTMLTVTTANGFLLPVERLVTDSTQLFAGRHMPAIVMKPLHVYKQVTHRRTHQTRPLATKAQDGNNNSINFSFNNDDDNNNNNNNNNNNVLHTEM
jgi:hypothetical protein